MLNFGNLVIHQAKDWTNVSKIVVKTGNQDLLNSFSSKIGEMSANGFSKKIYNSGIANGALRIFSQLGSNPDVLLQLLDGRDCNQLNEEVRIETTN